jgi:hypothetical protein
MRRLSFLLAVACATEPSPSTDPVDDDPADTPCVPTVGRTELRRLSNRELSHTIRDLLGADVARDLDLVVDEVFRGFDTVAAVQTTSLLHVERYAALAERLADAAVSGDLGVVRHEVEALDLPVGASHEFALGNETWWSFVGPSEADSSFALEVPEAGDYTLTAQAVWVVGWAAEGSELAPPSLSVEVGEVALPAQPILATFDVGEALTWDVTLPAGTTTVALHFDQLPQTYGVALDFVELRPATRRGWLQCDAAAIGEESCAREVLGTWMPRAWRRPVTPVEVDARIGLIATARAAGLSFEDALAQALQTVFLSPYFLYLPEPTGEIDPGTERPLDPTSSRAGCRTSCGRRCPTRPSARARTPVSWWWATVPAASTRSSNACSPIRRPTPWPRTSAPSGSSSAGWSPPTPTPRASTSTTRSRTRWRSRRGGCSWTPSAPRPPWRRG